MVLIWSDMLLKLFWKNIFKIGYLRYAQYVMVLTYLMCNLKFLGQTFDVYDSFIYLLLVLNRRSLKRFRFCCRPFNNTGVTVHIMCNETKWLSFFNPILFAISLPLTMSVHFQHNVIVFKGPIILKVYDYYISDHIGLYDCLIDHF